MKKKIMIVVGLLAVAQSAKAFDGGIFYSQGQLHYNKQYSSYARMYERNADRVLHSARQAQRTRSKAMKAAMRAWQAEQELERRAYEARDQGYDFAEYAPNPYADVSGHILK